MNDAWQSTLRFEFEDGDFGVTGFGSTYNANFRDRRWWFYVGKLSDETVSSASCVWETFELEDVVISLSGNQWISGVQSQYNKVEHDRDWMFYICTADSNVRA